MRLIEFESFQAQMNQCREAIETEDGEIYIHCLGNAIKRGITLALKLVEESNNGLAYEANTSTIDLLGNLLYNYYYLCVIDKKS